MLPLEDLARRLGGTLVGHRPLAGGVSSRVTALDLAMPDGATRRLVVREPGAAASEPPGASSARSEHDLLLYLRRAGLPVPAPVLLVDEPPCFVMERVEGTHALPPDGVAQMAAMLARLHAVSVEDAPFLPDREDPIERLPALLGHEHDALRARLAQRPPTQPPSRTLLHGDYWPGNILWRDRAIVALLDWEDAAIGDPLSDVACCRLELRYVLGSSAAAAFTRHYVQCTRRPLDGLPLWDAYVAAAALAFMGQWGLPAEREAHMRREAAASLADAASQLLG